jgi:hypothetical protein
MLGTNKVVTNFHLQDRLLGHCCVPSIERAKIIWEANYNRVAGHFGVEKIMAVLEQHFYWSKLRQDVNKYIGSYTACIIDKLTIIKKACTPLFVLLKGPGNPSRWNTYWAFHQPSGEMNVFLWWLIIFLKWRF